MIYFYDDSSFAHFPFDKALLGRCLGLARNEGNEMTHWFMKSNGQVVPRRTVKRLTAEQLTPSNAVEIAKIAAFDDDVKRRLGDSFSLPVNKERMKTQAKEDSVDDYCRPTPFLDLHAEDPSTIPEADCVDANRKPILEHSLTEILISAEGEDGGGGGRQIAVRKSGQDDPDGV